MYAIYMQSIGILLMVDYNIMISVLVAFWLRYQLSGE